MRLIHISDFHASTKSLLDQEVVVAALLKDIAHLSSERAADLLIISGDIAFSADLDEYRIATESLILPLMQSARIDDRRRVVLAPGNHDVRRATVNEYEELGLRAKLQDLDSVNSLLDDSQALAQVAARMGNWSIFAHEFYGDEEGEEFGGLLRFHAFDVEGVRLGVASYNSAWRSSGNDDQGHLLVGDRVVKAGVARAKTMDLRMAVMHHPPSWLADFDSRQLTLAMEGTFHILLTGHLHETQPVGVQRPGGGFLHSAAGALYGDGGRGYANSYTVLDVDLTSRQIRASFRAYQPAREEFDAGVSVAEGGHAVFDLPVTAGQLAESSSSKLGLTPAEYIERRERAGQQIAGWVREQSVIAPAVDVGHEYRTPVELLQLYVADPYFQRIPHEDIAAPPSASQRQPLTTDEVIRLSSDRVLVVSGDGGTGVTTALTWLLLHLADRDHGRFPILLHAHIDVQAGQRAFDTACRRALTLAGVSVPVLDELPPLLVAVNDADKLTGKRLDRLSRFIQSSSTSRFVLGCRRDHLDSMTQRLAAEGIDIATVHVGPFGRRHMRALVRKAVNSADEDRVVAAVSALTGDTVSGRAPFIVSALISLAAAEEVLQNVTDNVAITRMYAELLLGRNDRFEDSRVQLTYRNREHILQRIASNMLVDGDSGIVSRAELEHFLGRYFDSVGWQLPVSYVVDDLVRRWVLFEVRPAEFAFRQKPMHAFFAAGRAMEDPTFREFITREPTRWATVIEYMAGLPKNDEELLQQLYNAMPARLARGGTFAIESPEVVIDDVADLPDENEDLPPGPSTEELDDAFDPMLYGDASFQLGIRGPEADPVVAGMVWTRLVSNVLRSSELVENTDLKTLIFGSLIERWGDAADGMARHFQRLIEEHGIGFQEFVHAITGDESASGDDIDDGRLADVFSMIGVAIVLWGAIDSLASLKLDNALAPLKPGHPVWGDPAAALVATALHADARTDGWARYALELLEVHGRLEAVRIGVLAISVSVLNVTRARGERDAAERIFVRAVFRNTHFATEQLRNLAESSLQRQIHLWSRPMPAVE